MIVTAAQSLQQLLVQPSRSFGFYEVQLNLYVSYLLIIGPTVPKMAFTKRSFDTTITLQRNELSESTLQPSALGAITHVNKSSPG